MKATAYRYDAKQREDRDFNRTGREKNINAVRFYARSLEYAEKYKTIYDERGYEIYDCELETIEVNANLFDMERGYDSLNTFTKWLDDKVGVARRGYEDLLNRATTKRDKEMWAKEIANLDEYKEGRISHLKAQSFQGLSDYEYQTLLIAELTAKGYEGYYTEKEIALF